VKKMVKVAVEKLDVLTVARKGSIWVSWWGWMTA
jgi:hypothetical protein